MKILIFSQHFWPESFRINDIAIELSKRGHTIDVVTGKPNYPEGNFFDGYKSSGFSNEYWNNISIYRFPIVSRGNKTHIRLSLNYLSFIFSTLIFAPIILRKKSYDVIFVYGVSPIFQVLPASFFGWLKNIPVVLWVQDLWPQSVQATGYIKSKFILKMLEYLVKYSYSHTDLLLVQSKSFIKFVAKLAPKIPVKYYPNSVDKIFYNQVKDKTINIKSLESGFNIIFAGNIGTAQSIETIVKAAEKLLPFKKIKFIFFGNGSKYNWLLDIKKSKSLDNIFIEGRYPVETMPAFMRKASVLLVSLKNEPIFSLTVPNKIQAYLAVGKPIIASMNGEGARIIDESKAGISVPAEDPNSLVDAIMYLYKLTNRERSQLGKNGRSFFKKNYDEDLLVNDLCNHLMSVFSEK